MDALPILGASAYRIPLSTARTMTRSIVGASAGERTSDVWWSVLLRIVMVWVPTSASCAIIAYVAASIANELRA